MPSLAGDAPPSARSERRLVEEELLEREPLPRGLARPARRPGSARRPGHPRHPPCASPDAAGPGSARPRDGPSASPARPTRGSAAGADARSPGGRARSRSCAVPRGHRPAPTRGNSCSATLKPRFSSFPCSSSLVPGRSRSASQAWLNQTALAVAVESADLRLQDRQAPTAGGPQLRARDLDLDRCLLPQLQVVDAHRCRAVAIAMRDVPE